MLQITGILIALMAALIGTTGFAVVMIEADEPIILGETLDIETGMGNTGGGMSIEATITVAEPSEPHLSPLMEPDCPLPLETPEIAWEPAHAFILSLHPSIDPDWAEELARLITVYSWSSEVVERPTFWLEWRDGVWVEREGVVEEIVWSQDLDPQLLAVLCYIESSFRPITTGPAPWYCRGLFQVHYKSHKDRYGLTDITELNDPETNIRIGTDILRRYIADKGTLRGGLSRYGTDTNRVFHLYERHGS